MNRKTCFLISVLLPLFCLSARAADFYVDSKTGSDTNNGAASRYAWKSLEPVNAHVFAPGDRLWLKAGTIYTGQLKPQGSGTNANGKIIAIQIGKYGRGPLPRIDGEGKVVDTLLLRNVEFWEAADLEIMNLGTNREPWRTGVHILTDGFGTMHHIHLERLYVHDVNGDLRKDHEGCGIYFESKGGNSSHFDDLLIADCHVVRTDRNGICQRTSGRRMTHSVGVVIRDNLLEDIGGDGIKLWGSDGGLISHNVLHGGRMRCDDYAAGIWPFDCNEAVVEFNEVSGMRGTKDGQGFDSDYLCRRSIFQYNFSHNNDGGFMLLCAPASSFSDGAIVRYNISQNDGINKSCVFHFGGNVTDSKIYNNTIYVGTNQDLPLLNFTDWDGGWAKTNEFINNIFYVDGRTTYKWGKSIGNTFENNVFYGRQSERPGDSQAITNRPPLLKPGGGGKGFVSLNVYRWRGRTDFPLGQIVPDNGGRDFFGTSVSTNSSPAIGAVEFKR